MEKLSKDLKNRISEFQAQTEAFADLCEYVQLTHDFFDMNHAGGLLNSAIYIISQEARRIETVSDEIFNDIPYC